MAVPLSRIAATSGVSVFGVSSLEEGIALREGGIDGNILILGSIYPLENLAAAADYRLIPTISSLNGLIELVRLAPRHSRPLPFHLKIDTGMGRIGVFPESARNILKKIASLNEVTMKGMYTHFATADCDARYARQQIKYFLSTVAYARQHGLKFTAHAASSAALLRYPQVHCDMVRPGLSLYGMQPFEGANKKVPHESVLSWKTKIAFLKKVPAGSSISYGRTFTTTCPSVIATLPVGYADGYRRDLSNKAAVLVRGQRCTVVGRVTMDMLMVDVTTVKGVSIGDEAVLIGSQGAAAITAEEMAQWAGTISYEITCGISARVPRIII
jgi:alanine racemase